MGSESAMTAMEAKWAEPDGFYWHLRQGRLDAQAGDRARRALESVKDSLTGATVDRRLVSLVWYVPSFMEWQGDRFDGALKGEVKRLATEFRSVVEDILGVP